MTELNDYYGRIFTESQLTDDLKKKAKALPSVKKEKGQMICNRCGSVMAANQMLQTGRIYCRECLVFGRNTSDSNLYYFPQKPFTKTQSLKWQGQLTSYQGEVSKGMLKGILEKQDLLIHAVTGAGKTEMIYQSLAKVIDNGGSVCLTSPRIDVCLELYKRLSRNFSCPITLLHGDSEPYKRSPLVIITTHQLLKFYRAFDLLIIDEVDAFPFVDNKMLYHAVNQSLKDDGVKLFLTATSTDELDKKVKKGELTKLHLARRFHAYPLVVPKIVWLSKVLISMKKKKLPPKLISLLKKQRQSQFPLLIFFPNIEQGREFTSILQTTFPDERIGFVSSKTENRQELVEEFRQGKLTILVTTTILERGVTFPCVDVFVLLANHKLYSKSALVQISGRVGRAAERPTGELLFLHDGVTKAMKKAISEIKEMNKKGGF